MWWLGVVALLLVLTNTAPSAAQSKLALVVGNSAYVHAGRLGNPANDAEDVAAGLKQIGFEVIVGIDLDKRGFEARIRDFARRLPKSDVALFYYAGHGLQAGGRNVLIPIDAQLQTERDLDFEGVGLDLILKQMELERENKTSIVLLDACRDNPLARNLSRSMGTRSASIGQGLAQVQAGVGTFVAYSTQPGNVALDGDGRNSPFTAALVKAMQVPDRTITGLMIEVRKEVLAKTNGRQVPWDHSALTGDFYLHSVSAPGALRSAPKAAPDDTQTRLKQLEDELKKKSDPAHTQKVVELAQSRERLRRLEEENRRDQRKISDLMMNNARSPNQPGQLSFDIGALQRDIGQRSAEMRKLRDRVAELEKELGVTADAGAKK